MKIAFAIFALWAFAAATEVEVEKGVYIGTDENLQSLIQDNDHVLVEFYAPWCGHCKHLEPEYIAAAQEVSSIEGLKLVKVDATIHEESAQLYEVAGFPTIIFFSKGVQMEYSGGRAAPEIVAWLKKRTGPVSQYISTAEEFGTAIANNDVLLFGLFTNKESPEASAFLEAAARTDVAVFHSFDPATVSRQGLTLPSVTLFKKFDDGKTVFTGDLTSSSAINQFVSTESLPLVNVFTDESAQKIFGGSIKNHVLLFHKQSDPNFPALLEEFKKTARQFRGQFLFVTIDAEVDDHLSILDFFKITSETVPAVRLINLGEQMSKYVFADPITSTALSAFLTGYLSGDVHKTLNSEPTPADWDAKPVKVLTGENFNTVVNNPEKAAFVEFYAPWCGHCKELAPVWDVLAQSFADDTSFVVAKIDSTANELEHIAIQSFPTLKFFPKGDNKTPIDYDGDRDLEGLIAFVEAQTGSQAKEVEHTHNAHEHDEI